MMAAAIAFIAGVSGPVPDQLDSHAQSSAGVVVFSIRLQSALKNRTIPLFPCPRVTTHEQSSPE